MTIVESCTLSPTLGEPGMATIGAIFGAQATAVIVTVAGALVPLASVTVSEST